MGFGDVMTTIGKGVAEYGPRLLQRAGSGYYAGRTGDVPGAGQMNYAADEARRKKGLQEDLMKIGPPSADNLPQVRQIFLDHGFDKEFRTSVLPMIQRGEDQKFRREQATQTQENWQQSYDQQQEGRDLQQEKYGTDLANQEERMRLDWAKFEQEKADAVAKAAGGGDYKDFLATKKLYIDDAAPFMKMNQAYKNANEMVRRFNSGEEGGKQAYQVLGVMLQKLIDEASVVRESEFLRTEGFQSALGKVENIVSKWGSGYPSPELLAEVFGAIEGLQAIAEKDFAGLVSHYEDVSIAGGFRPELVMRIPSILDEEEKFKVDMTPQREGAGGGNRESSSARRGARGGTVKVPRRQLQPSDGGWSEF